MSPYMHFSSPLLSSPRPRPRDALLADPVQFGPDPDRPMRIGQIWIQPNIYIHNSTKQMVRLTVHNALLVIMNGFPRIVFKKDNYLKIKLISVGSRSETDGENSVSSKKVWNRPDSDHHNTAEARGFHTKSTALPRLSDISSTST
jgi:hypothetical protein